MIGICSEDTEASSMGPHTGQIQGKINNVAAKQIIVVRDDSPLNKIGIYESILTQ